VSEESVPAPPGTNDYSIPVIIYVLYFIGFFTALTALIGVIMAHVKASEADPDTLTHYRYQMRTFWFGLLMVIIGGVLAIVIIGWLILAWWFIWTLVRSIKGFLAAQERRPIPNPETLLW
jgi:uncharacterized membrane protein